MNGNGDAVPVWMAELGIKPGEWLRMSKAQLRVLQRPTEDLHIQVWATGMLHSPGYNGQEAVIMRGGKKAPITSGDIIRELHAVAKNFYAKAGLKLTDQQIAGLKEEKEEIRRVMVLLESYGVAMRTDAKGTPLRDLTPDQLRRLPSGRTRMFFWLTPKDADPEIVRRDWERRQPPEPDSDDDMSKVEVGIGRLPLPRIRQILNALKIDLPQKAEISTPEYQIKVETAYLAARKAFLECMEVGAGRLPQEGAGSLPQVGATGGAFESKAESNPLKAAAASGVETPKTERTAPPPPVDALLDGLKDRALLPDGELVDGLSYVIDDMPLEYFFHVLDDRLRRGRIGTGLLMSMARKARGQWEKNAVPPEPAPDRRREIEALREIAAHDEDPAAREYATAKLRDWGVAAEGAGGD